MLVFLVSNALISFTEHGIFWLALIYYFLCFLFRRTNELKSDIDIPAEVIMKFKLFWSDFKDTPLRGESFSYHFHNFSISAYEDLRYLRNALLKKCSAFIFNLLASSVEYHCESQYLLV